MTTDIATPHVKTTEDPLVQVRRARKSLLVFAGFLVPLSILGYWIWASFPDAPFILPH